MTRDAMQLLAALAIGPDKGPMIERFPDDARFDKPAGGYYWQLSAAHGTLRSRSLWDSALPVPGDVPATDWRLRQAQGPYEDAVSVLERRITFDSGSTTVVVQLAQDRAPFANAMREFGLELAGFLGVLWIVLSLAAWAQVVLGLRPLRVVRADLARLEKNASERLPDNSVDEIRPLIHAINALADARELDLERARHRAADLAHGLKTPLAALSAQTRRAREQGAIAAADGMERALAVVTSAVHSELARARIAMAGNAVGVLAEVLRVVEQLVTVVEQTDKGGELAYAVDVPASLRLPVRADDLSELLGPVLENAVRFARRQVRVRGTEDGSSISLWIEDDGPGIEEVQIETALTRGGRLDESQPGSGLGLAIAKELATAMGAGISLGKAELGGLAVCLNWQSEA
jgi:signal transduction histidine kinase